MANISIKKETSGVSFQKNTDTKYNIFSMPTRLYADEDKVVLRFDNDRFDFLSSDTITINDVPFSGTSAQICDKLRDEIFFLDVNSDAITKEGNNIFDIRDFGAVGNGIADDTVAIQAAINECYAAGGGIVLVPRGKYRLAGPLQQNAGGNIGNPNSQLYIPRHSHLDTGICIKFKGEGINYTVSGLTAYSNDKAASIIFSDIDGTGPFPSILSTDGNGLYYNLNYGLTVEVSDIVFQVKANVALTGPTMCGLNFSNLGNARVRNCLVNIDVPLLDSVYPYDETFGIRMPMTNNGTISSIDSTLIGGFKYGLVAAEHMVGTGIKIFCCEYGLMVENSYHSIHIDMIGIHYCPNLISGQLGNILGPAGQIYISIDHMSSEFRQVGDWYDSDVSVFDPNNFLHTDIKFAIVQADLGINNSLFTKIGGAYVNAVPIGTAADITIGSNNKSILYNNGGQIGSESNFTYDAVYNKALITTDLSEGGFYTKQTDSAKVAAMDVIGSNGVQGGIRFYGPNFVLSNLANRFGIGSNSGIAMFSDGLVESGGSNKIDVYVGGYGATQRRLSISSVTMNMPTLPQYADNAAAIAGGLQAGDLYKTATGDLKIRY